MLGSVSRPFPPDRSPTLGLLLGLTGLVRKGIEEVVLLRLDNNPIAGDECVAFANGGGDETLANSEGIVFQLHEDT